jgi:hypothetical protein
MRAPNGTSRAERKGILGSEDPHGAAQFEGGVPSGIASGGVTSPATL